MNINKHKIIIVIILMCISFNFGVIFNKYVYYQEQAAQLQRLFNYLGIE